jgi:hypothetical protein
MVGIQSPEDGLPEEDLNQGAIDPLLQLIGLANIGIPDRWRTRRR